ncbi:DUF423 domain-containing protein [Enterovirga sp.]|uniref:DUF423 domain-containing protein n=1 Tax=Enterovirga sp. TaxID=2026350 RepID=UPI00260B8C1E|nr:DUF423 domain-containing protein [Enterovirga sp.]MDB5591419.1 hypothetical protein [Enterovirga sp.]
MSVAAPVRALLVAAALAGGLGVVMSAVAAHAAPGSLDTAARFLLLHAPALLALAILLHLGLLHRAAGCTAAALLAIGLVLFCGDLTLRGLTGGGLLRWTAPAGGLALIAGWLALALAAALAGRHRDGT